MRGLPSERNRQPLDLALTGGRVRVQNSGGRLLIARVHPQRRPDLYMKARDFDFASGALGAGAFGLIET